LKKLFKIIAIALALLFIITVAIDIFSGETKSIKFYIAALFMAIIFNCYALKEHSK